MFKETPAPKNISGHYNVPQLFLLKFKLMSDYIWNLLFEFQLKITKITFQTYNIEVYKPDGKNVELYDYFQYMIIN